MAIDQRNEPDAYAILCPNTIVETASGKVLNRAAWIQVLRDIKANYQTLNKR